jgi:hypothetical protein
MNRFGYCRRRAVAPEFEEDEGQRPYGKENEVIEAFREGFDEC